VLRVIGPPVQAIVSLPELRTHLRLDGPVSGGSEDAQIAGFLRAATAAIDGPDGILRRALITQSLELTVPAFPDRYGAIVLPCPPLQEVLSVAYTDENGVDQALAPSVYHVIPGVTSPGRIILAHDQEWPATLRSPDAVRVIYTAGYGDNWNHVPEAVRHAVMLLVQGFYDNCGEGASGGAVWSLLRPYVVHAL
jgi:uncharacterized phiE125 gp8 family phage protein